VKRWTTSTTLIRVSAERFPVKNGKPAAVLDALRKLGAPPQCHVISVHGELDGRDVPLSDALEIVIGRRQGTFISCIAAYSATSRVRSQISAANEIGRRHTGQLDWLQEYAGLD
jgi:hypothetical protein